MDLWFPRLQGFLSRLALFGRARHGLTLVLCLVLMYAQSRVSLTIRQSAVAIGRDRDPNKIASIETGMNRRQALLPLAFAVCKPM